MKKFLSVLLFVFAAFLSTAQPRFQATVVLGPTADSLDVLIRPTTAFSGYLTNVIFVLQVPKTIVPAPTIGTRSLAANFTNFTVETDGATNGTTPDYNNFRIGATNSNTNAITIAGMTAYPLVRIGVTGGPSSLAGFRIAHLPAGGPTTTFQFYVEGINNAVAGQFANEPKMFYGTNSFPTVAFPDDGSGYAAYQYAEVGSTLPVKWLNFSAVRQSSDVALNWAVSTEENVSQYELEVSSNGTNFITLATQRKSVSNGSKNYAHLDKGVARYNSKVLYYRVKQVDANSTFSYTPIKSIRLDVRGDIALYPNPAREGFTLNVPYLQPDQKRIQLQLVSSSGQIIERRDITRVQAVNYYYSLQAPSILSGEYLLKIYEDGVLTETKPVLIKK